MQGRALRATRSVVLRQRKSTSSGSTPSYLDSALTAQKETEGVADFVATLGISTNSVLLLSFVGVRTALVTNPPTGNNSNSYTQVFNQAYGNGFTNYSLRGYKSAGAAGGSAHSATSTKTSSTAEEATIALVAISNGNIFDSNVTQQVNAGAGHTFTSGNVTLTKSGILVAVASGDGNVNATAPTQTWPGTWTVRQSVAFSSAAAPNGHIPLYVATRAVSAGTYSVDVQVTIDEGLTLALYAIQE